MKWWLLLCAVAVTGAAVFIIYKTAGGSGAVERPRPQVTVSSNRLDFGSTALHTPVVRQLLLRNDGKEPVVAILSLEATLSGTSFATDVTRVTLQPAASSRIPIRLQANRPGECVDRLKITFPGGVDPLLIELRGQAFAGTTTHVASRSGPDGTLESSRSATDAAPGSVDTGQPLLDAERDQRGESSSGAARSVASAAPSPKERRFVGAAGTPESGAAGQGRPLAYAGDRVAPGGAGTTRVYEFDPKTSAPVISIAGSSPAVSDRITPQEQASASPLHEQVPDQGPTGSDNSDTRDSPVEEASNTAQSDSPKSDPKQPDPKATPTFTLSGLSAVTLLGTSVRFSPQGIKVTGTNSGGAISLSQLIQFPIVPLAFGESMLISQVGAGSGVFEPSTGAFKLQLPLVIVDSDGDAAPVVVELTTGTSYGKNDSGIVVSMSGSPWTSGSGWLKLVGLQKIPVGYRNGAEDNLVSFEILGQLNFNDGAMSSL